MDKNGLIIGIDEVGRGPIAGPVTVCAFVLFQGAKLRPRNAKLKLKDSKKLSPRRREEWFQQVDLWKREGKVDYSVVSASARDIDMRGISRAIASLIAEALANLGAKDSARILLDGGLKAPDKFKNQKTFIKGDETEKAISLASICAKVTRDGYMAKQSKKYPKHQFYLHKGYGTQAHYQAIRMHGLTPLHRRTFLKKFLTR